jgi:hypothetical protein
MKLNSDLLLGIVYIPPEYSRYSSRDAFSQIENEYLEFTEKIKNICLIGDFNARTTEDDEFKREYSGGIYTIPNNRSEFSFINFDDILHHNANLFSVSITSISPSNFSL